MFSFFKKKEAEKGTVTVMKACTDCGSSASYFYCIIFMCRIYLSAYYN